HPVASQRSRDGCAVECSRSELGRLLLLRISGQTRAALLWARRACNRGGSEGNLQRSIGEHSSRTPKKTNAGIASESREENCPVGGDADPRCHILRVGDKRVPRGSLLTKIRFGQFAASCEAAAGKRGISR